MLAGLITVRPLLFSGEYSSRLVLTAAPSSAAHHFRQSTRVRLEGPEPAGRRFAPHIRHLVYGPNDALPDPFHQPEILDGHWPHHRCRDKLLDPQHCIVSSGFGTENICAHLLTQKRSRSAIFNTLYANGTCPSSIVDGVSTRGSCPEAYGYL